MDYRESSADLLADTLIMDDFAPDIDLLDDILGMTMTDDWYNIEPSINLQGISSAADSEQQLFHTPLTPPQLPHSPSSPMEMKPDIFMTSSMSSPGSDHYVSSPDIHMTPVAPVTSMVSNPPTQLTQILKPIQPQAVVQQQAFRQEQVIIPQTTLNSIITTTNSINSNLIAITDKKPNILPQNTQMQQIFSIPVYTNQPILLPQLSLAVLESADKLPVKRLTNEKPKKKEASRRSSHNAIERRYRSSINDKIIELKKLVYPTEGNDKVHKAAILKASIDTIRQIKGANVRLEKENKHLKLNSKCINCGYETGKSSVRELLQGPSTPPFTSSSDSESGAPSPSSSQGSNGSPLALFAIAAGIFFLNPITIMDEDLGRHGKSRVERSIEPEHLNQNYFTTSSGTGWGIWAPRILALCFNLILFMLIYFIIGKLSKRRFKKSTYNHKLINEVSKLYQGSRGKSELERRKDLESLLEMAGEKAGCMRHYKVMIVSWKLVYKIFSSKRVTEQDQDYCYYLARACIDLGKMDKSNSFYYGLKGVFYALDARSYSTELILSACVLTKSKLLLRLVMIRLKSTYSTHALLSKTGLPFLLNNIRSEYTSVNRLTACIDEKDPLSNLLHQYKEEMIEKGIENLFDSGSNSNSYFKGAMQAVLNERNNKIKDFNCEWWSAILWCESEWVYGGRKRPVLERLYKLVDTLWKFQDYPLSKVFYYCHLAKRIHYDGDMKKDQDKFQRLINNASEDLRDSINLAVDKPKYTIHLLWALAAEWILELRITLWEENCDANATIPFQKDLDTLRSLTHYVPDSLPSVFLYEACLRLMSRASPGRTLQLLDASLRSSRFNHKVGLICTETENCNKRYNGELNLVREKRKAMALYLRCKFMPAQIITCPGEKAGLLREALKALEKFGDRKKIKECLEMMRKCGEASIVY